MAGRVSEKRKNLLLLLWASLLALFTISPYLYMLLQSFASWDQVEKSLIPTSFTLRSYFWIFSGGGTGTAVPWLRGLLNSFIVSLSTATLQLSLAMLVGYAITKLRFRGSRLVENFILFQMFFPTIILLVPQLIITYSLGMSDRYLGMIVPKMVSMWAIFMYINYFRSLPSEVLEAARIDGAEELRIVTSIVFPMSRSLTTILFLFLFMERWNELLWDMLVTTSYHMKTFNVLLSSMFGPYKAYAGPLFAASVLLTFPILLLFIGFSKNFREGINFVIK